jgi:pimeloyl-ACP methyl ester carboxylesterase
MDTSPGALIEAAAELRKRGYRKIVSAGQSFGAWISLAAAGQAPKSIDAIIALAPAAHGEFGISPSWTRNADGLYELAQDVPSSTRVLTFFFDKDNLDPGGRAAPLDQIFKDRQVPHAIVDRPPGFAGHGVGQTHAFAHVYGRCIVAFVEAPAIAKDFSCTPHLQLGPGAGFNLPPDIRIVPAPSEATTLAAR